MPSIPQEFGVVQVEVQLQLQIPYVAPLAIQVCPAVQSLALLHAMEQTPLLHFWPAG